ncbi:hypothetical protein [Granulicella aggregans]|jgi:hypothetical protein|uniref:hypothetical protein n=1 Tax=Granulicella aggregans TaxID=474949 RepID=UPI0021E01E43|nr:hypothetical protein [Granulicella aggregans]
MQPRDPIMRKERSREIRADIRRVLLDTWDPIGIANEPNAQDEYKSYLGGVYAILSRGGSVDELQDHLLAIVRDCMGMSPPVTREHMRSTAEALKQISILL